MRPLVDELTRRGCDVWWDRRIDTGSRYDREIQDAIDASACIIVVWSAHSIDSNWVITEASEGLERGILAPVMIDEVRPPLAFRRTQTLRLIDYPTTVSDEDLNSYLEVVATRFIGRTAAPARVRPDDRSIAVLRFDDMSPEQDQRYLCEGISEEILDELAHNAELKVGARTSSFRMNPSRHSVKEIGQTLGVKNVLEGSVRTAGDRVRITAQLIDTETEYHRWSKTYGGLVSDVFALYDEIKADVARELGAIVTQAKPGAVKPAQKNFEAYKLVLKARSARASMDYLDTVRFAKEAIELEPGYFEANVLLGWGYYNAALFRLMDAAQGSTAAKAALAECQGAFADHWGTHTLAGQLYSGIDRDFRSAAAEFASAEAIRGLPVEQHGWLLYYMRRFEDALTLFNRLEEVNPIDGALKCWIVRCLDGLGREDEGTVKIEEALLVSPNDRFVRQNAVIHFCDVLNFDRAEEVGAGRQAANTVKLMQALAEGRADEARGILANEEHFGFLTLWMYYRLGDYEEHFEHFRQSVEKHIGGHYFYVSCDRWMDRKPDLRDALEAYWQTLRDWSLASPARTAERVRLVDEHRRLVDQVTQKMTL